MKKKVLIIALACVLSVGALTACGSKPADAKTTVSQAQKSEADYATWTAKEWEAADDKAKEAAAKYFLVETTKAASKAAGAEYTAEIEKAMVTDEAISLVLSSLDLGFAADENTKLSDLLKISVEAAEQAAAAE